MYIFMSSTSSNLYLDRASINVLECLAALLFETHFYSNRASTWEYTVHTYFSEWKDFSYAPLMLEGVWFNPTPLLNQALIRIACPSQKNYAIVTNVTIDIHTAHINFSEREFFYGFDNIMKPYTVNGEYI